MSSALDTLHQKIMKKCESVGKKIEKGSVDKKIEEKKNREELTRTDTSTDKILGIKLDKQISEELLKYARTIKVGGYIPQACLNDYLSKIMEIYSNKLEELEVKSDAAEESLLENILEVSSLALAFLYGTTVGAYNSIAKEDKRVKELAIKQVIEPLGSLLADKREYSNGIVEYSKLYLKTIENLPEDKINKILEILQGILDHYISKSLNLKPIWDKNIGEIDKEEIEEIYNTLTVGKYIPSKLEEPLPESPPMRENFIKDESLHSDKNRNGVEGMGKKGQMKKKGQSTEAPIIGRNTSKKSVSTGSSSLESIVLQTMGLLHVARDIGRVYYGGIDRILENLSKYSEEIMSRKTPSEDVLIKSLAIGMSLLYAVYNKYALEGNKKYKNILEKMEYIKNIINTESDSIKNKIKQNLTDELKGILEEMGWEFEDKEIQQVVDWYIQ